MENSLIVEREIKNKLKGTGLSELEKLYALIEQLKKDEKEGRLPTINKMKIKGDKNIGIQDVSDSQIDIQTGNTTHQKADKIYNIKKIEKADFS